MMENKKSEIRNSKSGIRNPKSSLRDASRLVDLIRRAGCAFGFLGDIKPVEHSAQIPESYSN